MSETSPIEVTKDELWLLQRYVRHEMADAERWHFPPVSLELNDQVADALRVCEKEKWEKCTLLLTRGDCLLIDFVIPQDAKTPGGTPLGKDLLMKTFVARYRIDNGDELSAPEPPQLSHEEIGAAIAHLEKE